MTLGQIKIGSVAILILQVFAVVGLKSEPVKAVSLEADDPAATYKAKCAACHSAKAEKFFDPAKTDEELIQTVLKGKKGEKPPYMPGFEAKGMTADEAKSLVQTMRGLREPPK